MPSKSETGGNSNKYSESMVTLKERRDKSWMKGGAKFIIGSSIVIVLGLVVTSKVNDI